MTKSPKDQFFLNENGGGTGFSLFIFIALCMILGLSVDATNAWRNRTLVTQTADIAAHAGVVKLATGHTDEEVVDEVERMVEANLPASAWGNLVIGEEDVIIAGFDKDTREIDFASTERNAVLVRLRRGEDRGNAIGTFLLKFAGINRFEVEGYAVAVFDTLAVCGLTEGLFAQEKITLTSQNNVGAGICVHSEDHVWLPQQNTFAEGSVVSMPDLDDCQNKCTEEANPGIYAIESHQVFPDFRQMVIDAHAQFQQAIGDNDRKDEAFEGIESDDAAFIAGQTPLISAGLIQSARPVGTVVPLTISQFNALERLPTGLVYNVDCPDNGNGPSTQLTFSGSKGKMDQAVLISDCNIHFDDGSEVIGSTVVTIRDVSNATITSSSSVTIGAPSTTPCSEEDTTTIMSVSKMNVPAEFAMSNVTIVVGDDINLASATSSGISSNGIAVYAQGEIHVAAQHTFNACNLDNNIIEPDLDTLRLVLPVMPAQVAMASP